jgi:uncharacterized protein involved in exopolysaccharide biosynthesis
MADMLKAKAAEFDLLTLVSNRLGVDRSIYQGTYDRFVRLLEQSRIAREQSAGDVQIASRAVQVRRVPVDPTRGPLLVGAVGLIASVFLAFLLEYIAKARNQKQASGAPA